jgi:Rrf2 family protein
MLGKTTEYAIRALVYIYIQNLEGNRPGFKEIAKMIDSPEQFTGKVLQNLTRAELVSSMKGRGGGFFFNEPENPITLFKVIEALEGNEYFSKCGFGLKRCDVSNPCPLHEDYAPVRDSFFKMVNERTIQSLANKISKREATLNRL